MVVTDRGRERFQREQQIRQHLRVVADRLTTADRERTATIAAAHRQGLSVRQIAAAVRLSSARVHQLLHAPASETNVLAAAPWEAPVDPIEGFILHESRAGTQITSG